MSTSSSPEYSRPESASSAKSSPATPKSAGRVYVDEPLPKAHTHTTHLLLEDWQMLPLNMEK